MKTMTFDTDNLGGLLSCIAIPVDGYSLSYNYATKAYTLYITTNDAVEIKMFADNTFSYSETHGRDEHGDYWEPSVSGTIPRLAAENAHLIEELERGEWVVLVEDNNGVCRLCGNQFTPMSFDTDAGTGRNVTDMNGTSFTFSAKMGIPSVVITSVE